MEGSVLNKTPVLPCNLSRRSQKNHEKPLNIGDQQLRFEPLILDMRIESVFFSLYPSIQYHHYFKSQAFTPDT